MMHEMEGFVVYKPHEKPVYISAHDKSITVSSGACTLLGMPEYVNVFIDECGRRVMMKAAEPSYENVLKVIEHSSGRNRVICNRDLTQLVRGMFGRSVHVTGHPAGDGCVIFDRVRKNQEEK